MEVFQSGGHGDFSAASADSAAQNTERISAGTR
jgi:hypothetical protein